VNPLGDIFDILTNHTPLPLHGHEDIQPCATHRPVGKFEFTDNGHAITL
jgi:hypothetical protein